MHCGSLVVLVIVSDTARLARIKWKSCGEERARGEVLSPKMERCMCACVALVESFASMRYNGSFHMLGTQRHSV